MSLQIDLSQSERSVLNLIKNGGNRPVATLDIVRKLGQNKKVINATLYKLRTLHIIEKACEIPPTWILTVDNGTDNFQKKHENEKASVKTFDTSLEGATANIRPLTSVRPRDGICISERILAYLENEVGSDTFKARQIALALGFAHKREINPFLYQLQRKGLIIRVSESPPLWKLNMNEYLQKKLKLPKKSMSSGANDCTEINDVTLAMQDFQLKSNPDNIEENKLSLLSPQDFLYMTKNPITTFLEYAQCKHVSGEINIISTSGPAHDPSFHAQACLGQQSFPSAAGKNKKQAKTLAAEVAIKILAAQGFISNTNHGMKVHGCRKNTTLFDQIALLSHRLYYNLTLNLNESFTAGRKIIATVVMKRGDSEGVVVSLGSGNRAISGGRLSQDGNVLNDCHAEVIARRGFRRYLSQQLIQSFKNQSSDSIFEHSQENLFQVKKDVTFHLYISTSPCGDGAIFTHNDLGDAATDCLIEDHIPIYSKTNHGRLRTKIENGEGSIPIDNNYVELTWDGVMRGDQRLLTMSCSDKIAKWNVLGLQGALLSHFLKPVYLSSVTIGYLFSKGHLSRALCCRLARDFDIDELLPENFRLNHPMLGNASVGDPVREAQKTKVYSLNWTVGCGDVEVVDSTTGQCLNSLNPKSQLCKQRLYAEFRELCRCMQMKNLLKLKSYFAAKEAAVDYRNAQRVMEKQFATSQMGQWIHKPVEEKDFVINE